jgi:hypothetical protein
MQGIASENQAELAIGTEMHRRHGRSIAVVGCLRLLAYTLLLASLAMLTIYGVSSLLE